MCLHRQQAPRARKRRMIRRLVAEIEAQKFAQTQAVGQAPGDPSFATDALAVANQKSSEIDARCDARPALDRLVEAPADEASVRRRIPADPRDGGDAYGAPVGAGRLTTGPGSADGCRCTLILRLLSSLQTGATYHRSNPAHSAIKQRCKWRPGNVARIPSRQFEDIYQRKTDVIFAERINGSNRRTSAGDSLGSK